VPSAGQIGGANGFAGLNNVMNSAQAMREGMVRTCEQHLPQRCIFCVERLSTIQSIYSGSMTVHEKKHLFEY